MMALICVNWKSWTITKSTNKKPLTSFFFKQKISGRAGIMEEAFRGSDYFYQLGKHESKGP